MRWTVCVRNCTRSEGCLTMIDTVLDCSNQSKLQRQHSVLMRKRRALILKTPQNVDFLSTALAPMPLAPDPLNTRRARMTGRPLVSECRDETTCLRPNVPTGHKCIVSPNTTEGKTLQSGTAANTSTDVRQPKTCYEQTQPRATVPEQPRTHQSEHH